MPCLLVCDLFLRRFFLRTAARNEDRNSPVVTVKHMLATPPTLGRLFWHQILRVKAKQSVPLRVQLEQSLKFVERSEKWLRFLDKERAKEGEGGQAVGGSETTFRTFAFRVGSRETTPPSTNCSSKLLTGICSCESLRGGIVKRPEDFVHKCEARGAVVGGAGHCPIHFPDLFTGKLQHCSVVNKGHHRLSSVMETLIDNAESAKSNHRFNTL